MAGAKSKSESRVGLNYFFESSSRNALWTRTEQNTFQAAKVRKRDVGILEDISAILDVSRFQ